jgi:Sulfatase
MSSQSRRDQAITPTPSRRSILLGSTTLAATAAVGSGTVIQTAQAQQPASSPATSGGAKPNIIFIMADDIGWSNIGVYNQGIMAGRTPNLDRMANEGMRFTDYYAEASCTAGRANFRYW